MKNKIQLLSLSIILVSHISILIVLTSSSKSNNKTENSTPVIFENSKMPFSYYKIYRGNTHAHTIITWTHGAHRDKSVKINDSTALLNMKHPFRQDWGVPETMSWKDYNTVSFNPEDYTNLQGLPENHFKLAKENGYDFYVITDHSHEPLLQPVSNENHAWIHMMRAAKKFTNDNFVAIHGFEYSRNTEEDGGQGHINVINSESYISADHGKRGPVLAWPEANWSLPQFYNWLKNTVSPSENNGQVVATFNHPQLEQYNDWDHVDEDIVPLISNFELHSKYKPLRWEAYIRALNKGWKVSPIGVLDNHELEMISDSKFPPPTIVLAPELTKEAILEALRKRRTYVSYVKDTELKYSVNDYIMGSTIEKQKNGNYQFNIEIKTSPSVKGDEVKLIQILSDNPDSVEGYTIITENTFDKGEDVISWNPIINNSSARYFLLRVYHVSDLNKSESYSKAPSTISGPIWTN